MKVILNQDVKHLGEEGDVKDVANGYARNYLFPRNLAVPHNEITLAYFESRRAEIDAKKAAKRADAAGLKENLEALTVTLVMPAGTNGKLYGAVTNQTVADELKKLGFEIERKRIEIPGLTIKSVGKYHATCRLYESAIAGIQIVVEAQKEAERAESHKAERSSRRHAEEAQSAQAAAAAAGSAGADEAQSAESAQAAPAAAAE